MSKKGPLIIVDDDIEDQELMLLTLQSLQLFNQVKVFETAELALAYLQDAEEDPFMILSDINMPRMDGISFKKAIEASELLKSKCIPFIFISTSAKFAEETCDLNVQGYFEKGNSLEQLKDNLRVIITYWMMTHHTN